MSTSYKNVEPQNDAPRLTTYVDEKHECPYMLVLTSHTVIPSLKLVSHGVRKSMHLKHIFADDADSICEHSFIQQTPDDNDTLPARIFMSYRNVDGNYRIIISINRVCYCYEEKESELDDSPSETKRVNFSFTGESLIIERTTHRLCLWRDILMRNITDTRAIVLVKIEFDENTFIQKNEKLRFNMSQKEVLDKMSGHIDKTHKSRDVIEICDHGVKYVFHDCDPPRFRESIANSQQTSLLSSQSIPQHTTLVPFRSVHGHENVTKVPDLSELDFKNPTNFFSPCGKFAIQFHDFLGLKLTDFSLIVNEKGTYKTFEICKMNDNLPSVGRQYAPCYRWRQKQGKSQLRISRPSISATTAMFYIFHNLKITAVMLETLPEYPMV